ncbi:MAG: response regulator [Chloroflexi bacterium]|nr:response regulator [Chloroflexota bacterium]
MTGTVLIVDDESAGRDTVESILDGEGYVLLMATNGAQAIEMARTKQPDIILMDVMMPGMTGFEACRHIRSDSDLAEIPIILLTALDDRKSLLTGLDAGADDFITKPFDRYELRARLAGIMRLNRFRKLVQERNNVEEEHKKLQLAYDATIEGWSHAMDLRDKETEGHTQRVTELTLKMANALHIGEENLAHIRRGALLHDIGKLGVPDAILLKEGKLTDEEWVIMRKHPIYAHEMLSQIEYLRPALDIPYCHHEKWDGTGYPRGLKGEEIPLVARMFAIVDVWDAVTSDRPYRAAWSKEQALAYIIEHSGTQFDPEIVQVFLKVIKKEM